uniref:Uncharacterized protein n=1 Tax=Tolypothrix bouteillei VB521301 TaxID=1479485 RepID=A0A0C1R6X6_9CYAN
MLKSVFLTGLVMTGIASTSLCAVKPVVAQEEGGYELIAPTGVVIKGVSTGDRPVYLDANRSYEYHLRVPRGTYFGNTYIPAGAVIEGKFEPTRGGLRYVANSVSFDDMTYGLNASSDLIEGYGSTSRNAVAKDTGIGAATGVAIDELFGHHLSLGHILGGAAAGAAVGAATSSSSHQVVTISPDRIITLYNSGS